MSSSIQLANADFTFSNLTLANPQGLQGGAYFSKLRMGGEPVLIQTPKCYTKNGIHKTEKATIILFSTLKLIASKDKASAEINFTVKKAIQKPIISDPVSPINIFLDEEKLNRRYAANTPIKPKLNKK